ncbi:MAG: response regulator [Myxococcales bacterium]
MIRILLAEDQRLVREGIRGLLERLPGVRVIAESADGEAALEAARRSKPDLLLLDVRMPKLDGIAVVEQLGGARAAAPAILLTTFDDDDAFARALRAGARGFLLKDASLEELERAIRTVLAGGTAYLPGLVARAAAARGTPPPRPAGPKLSAREVEIVRLMARGLSNREIASAFGTAEGTVKNQVSSLLLKLGARDRTHAVLKAIELGLG